MAKHQNKKRANSTVNLMEYLSGLDEYIKQNVKLFLTELSFQESFFEKKVNYILVEGKNDYDFFKNEKFDKFNNNNYYIPIECLTNFINGNDSEEEPKPMAKQLIVKILKAKLLCKSFYDSPLFAIVDRDFDDEYPNLSVTTQDILSNDTHDLETLMISTDNDVFKKLPIDNLSLSSFTKALYMAYQIGCVKQVISNSHFYLDYNTTHDFNCYFGNAELDIQKYINFLGSNSNKASSNINQIIKQLRKEGKINCNNKFVTTLEEFTSNPPKDIWFIINGHDFTDALQFVLNRKIKKPTEMLINFYNAESFKKSKLFEKMKINNLIK